MLKGLGDIGQIMKLQKEMKNTQKNIMKTRMEGQSRNGEVTATVTGEYKVVKINIDESLFEAKAKDKLESSIAEAVNNAVEKVKDYSSEEMGKLTGGMNIPGLANFLK